MEGISCSWGELNPGNGKGILQLARALHKSVIASKGDLRKTGDDFVRQLGFWTSRDTGTRMGGAKKMFSNAARDFLEWLNGEVSAYNAWVGADCLGGSACRDFRDEVNEFLLGIGDIQANLSVLDDVQPPNLGGVTRALDQLPPLLFYPLHRATVAKNNARSWPILDKLGEIEDAINSIPVWAWKERQLRQDTFCGRVARVGLDDPILTDPIRVSSTRLTLQAMSRFFESLEESVPDDLNVTIVGEGIGVPTFAIKSGISYPGHLMGFAAEVLTEFATNVETCNGREEALETQIAECVPLAIFKRADGSDAAYQLVLRRIEDHENVTGDDQIEARKHLTMAADRQARAEYSQAFVKICSAYVNIGSN